METFDHLYDRLLKATISDQLLSDVEEIKRDERYNQHNLDCLLNPKKYAPVVRTNDCSCSPNENGKTPCEESCMFSAISKDDNGNAKIDAESCVGCRECLTNCDDKVLKENKELVPLLQILMDKDRTTPVYAMIAPAIVGQFSNNVTPGMLRTAFKKLGFEGMIEVALFADILTLKEALEFDRYINDENDFLLTSCCCPIWIAMIRKIYNKLIPHVPASVSPMVACGRSIKKLVPDAITVFIGPCIAKKSEAREKDIADAVDYVLTFQEVQQLFELTNINPELLEEDLRDHSSTGGRIYAKTGGVSSAVEATFKRLRPDNKINFIAQQADGVPACKELLNKISNGEVTANFIEGMGCKGGCVGGPKAIINKDEGRKFVEEYGQQANFETPVDNTFVLELLKRLGFDRISSLLNDDSIFIRKW